MPRPIRAVIVRFSYVIRSLVPRAVQIGLRRFWAGTVKKRVVDRWPIISNSCIHPEGFSGWPGGKKFAFVIRHDVESNIGLSKCRQLAEIDASFGFRSSFNFVPYRYDVPDELINFLVDRNYEIGVHGLFHDGRLYSTQRRFLRRAMEINRYLKLWNATGFYSPSSHHRRLDWLHQLNIEYDSSTFDTDPFEPENDGVGRVFPFKVCSNGSGVSKSYIEIPYTMPQDFTLYVLFREDGNAIWHRKFDWLADCGALVFFVVHPDYIDFGDGGAPKFSYPVKYYRSFLHHVQNVYENQYWHALPREVARFWKEIME